MREQLNRPTGTEPALDRRLGTGDAVVIGLSAMIGAGVFAAFAPASRAAGSLLIVGLVIAAVVAYCNATSSAQLAAQYPSSGGTYVYGRERLGEWWGFLAGWGFVVGKTASCAAMALTFAAYAVHGPEWLQRLAALVAVAALTAVNYRGITKTSSAARVLLAVTLVGLVVVVVAVAAHATGSTSQLTATGAWSTGGWYGVLQSAGLLFFAFAGYARIATLGEEVRDPARTIPRAIPLALAVAGVLYAAVAVVLLVSLGPRAVAADASPVATAGAGVADWVGWLVRVAAVAGSLGALLALVAGIGRTSLAMARNGDLPGFLAGVHPRYRVPHHAEVAVGVVVAALVLTTDLRGVIGFSSFGVLLYYAVANAAAFTQQPDHRRWGRGWQVLGLVGCLVLVATLPRASVVVGLLVMAVGGGLRLVAQRASWA